MRLWKTIARKTMHASRRYTVWNGCSALFSTAHSVGNVENEYGKTSDFQQFPKGFPQDAGSSAAGFPQDRTANLKKTGKIIIKCEQCGKTENDVFSPDM